jgi:hypothetical protein
LVPEGTAVAEETLRINVILAEEVDAPALPEPLHWVLLTAEAVNDAESALQVVRYYEMRWRIEGYHKVWKSGIGVERQRFQSVENLERMMVITAFLAVRLLQLRAQIDRPLNTPETTYAAILAEDEWKVLWLSTESNQLVPQTPPLPRGRFMPSQSWADLPIPSIQGVLVGTRSGGGGFAYKNDFEDTNSASSRSLTCDQETGCKPRPT